MTDQKIPLFDGFHTLGNDRQIQLLRQHDDSACQCRIVGV